MALVKADRVRETSTTTGTATYTLAGAEVGFRTFSSAVGNGNTCPYFSVMGSNWEAGIGTVAAGTLTRTNVMTSSNANNPVSWGAGTKQVALGIPAGLLPMLQGDNEFLGSVTARSSVGDTSVEVRVDGDFTPRLTLRKASTSADVARVWQLRVDVTGGCTLRDATSSLDRIAFTTAGHLWPGVHDAQNLGDSAKKWRALYAGQSLIIDSDPLGSVDLNLVSHGDGRTPNIRMIKSNTSSDTPMEYRFDIDTSGRLRCTNNTDSVSIWMINHNNDFTPVNDTVTLCGSPAARWTAVYAVNGAIQTSDAREKTDVVDGELGLDFLAQLRPVSYRRHEEDPQTRHYGLIAQEVAAALAGRRFDGLSYDAEADRWGLNYAELVPVLIRAVQELLQLVSSQARPGSQAMGQLASQARAAGIPFYAGMRNWGVFSGTSGLQTLVQAQFTGLVPGNALKWVNTQPTQGTFSFTEADQFVSWADARNMPLRCMPLVWHFSLAPWVAGAVNSSSWDNIIDAHIDGVLSHYPSRVWDIDVVNEPFSEVDGNPGGYRTTLWYTAAGGPDYIPYAFERARIHNPVGRLFLAQNGTEHADEDARRNNMLVAIEDWLSQSVPIDGVAIQGHLKMDKTLDKPALLGFIRDLRGLGLKVIVSELDCQNISTLGLSDSKAFAYIGAYTQEFLTTVLQAGASSVTAWGVAPEDWGDTATEQIAAVPFGASPGFARTSMATALSSGFQSQILAQPDKELVIAVELLVTL